MKLTENHLKLFLSVFEEASYRLSRAVCNDLEPHQRVLLTSDQWKELCKECHTWNGDPEEFELRTSYHMQDWEVLDFLLEKILQPLVAQDLSVYLTSDTKILRRVAEGVAKKNHET